MNWFQQHFRIIACLAFGYIVGWGLSYLIPQPAISTLCHQILHLPGPGVGIALIYGPLIISALLLGRNILQSNLGTVLTAGGLAIFSVVSNGKMPPAVGAQVILTVLATLTLGAFLELLILLFWRFKAAERFAAMFANLFYICCYWVFIFPHTKGIPNILGVIEIGAIAILCGILITPLITQATRRFLKIKAIPERRHINQER
ncbi:MAG: hypothetical protein ABH871_05895 [Pseudomonadota bacterium]